MLHRLDRRPPRGRDARFWDRSETPGLGERTAIEMFPMMRYDSLDLAEVQQFEYMNFLSVANTSMGADQ
jgi:hypothetical protein